MVAGSAFGEFGSGGAGTALAIGGVVLGADEIWTGGNKAWYGLDRNSLTFMAAEKACQAAGGENCASKAAWADFGLKFGTNIGLLGLSSNASRVGGVASGPATGDSLLIRNPNYFVHYTNESGYNAILQSGELFPSIGAVNGRFGNGQYLTDVLPQFIGSSTIKGLTAEQIAAGQMSSGQLSRYLFGVPWNSSKISHFIVIDTGGFTVLNPRPGTFLIPGSTPLNLNGRIIDSGRTLFK